MAQSEAVNTSHALFERFAQAQTCKEVLLQFSELCRHLEVDPKARGAFYPKLKERLNYWKAKTIWAKLDKRAAHPDYQQGQPCARNQCLVLGAGPCGLRTAIELVLLGAKVILLEKRDSFSRNNVLHLWPYTIHDLRGLAAKKFYGKFCTGSLDHISIRQLQLILLKVALLMGVEVHTGVEYKGLREPQAGASGVTGWRAELHPESHPAASFEFDVFISAGGGRFVPNGFKRKELRGKLAIGITANFINHRTAEESQVAEISGVARIYNQKFFQDLLTETGIDLENIVYYKDDTHYFVMTAKKKSLINKGVLKQDHSDAKQLLSPANVDQEALRGYAIDAAHFSTGQHLPSLVFAPNHAGQPDVAAFDFTCMYRAENASLVRERRGRKLLIGLVGDCLVEPFWPLGTGIARGFLAAYDAAWMVRRWGLGSPPLEVMAERESIYQLLSQTTPENTSKNYATYSINPTTRYPNINISSIKASQVQHLYQFDDIDAPGVNGNPKDKAPPLRQDSVGGYVELLEWCQQRTAGYEQVKVTDLTTSWRSGLAMCALVHHFSPHLIDFSALNEADGARNNQLAFDVVEQELGVSPIMCGADMVAPGQPDKLSMVLYLTQIYQAFSERTPPTDKEDQPPLPKLGSFVGTHSAVRFLSKLKHCSLQRRKEKQLAEKQAKERELKEEKVDIVPGSSELCYFCGQRVYVLERVSAEGRFFHRGCFTCQRCSSTLWLGSYSFHSPTGSFFCVQHSEEYPVVMGEEPSCTQDITGGDAGYAEENGDYVAPQSILKVPREDQKPGSSEALGHGEQSAVELKSSLAGGSDGAPFSQELFADSPVLSTPPPGSTRDNELVLSQTMRQDDVTDGQRDAPVSILCQQRAPTPPEIPPFPAVRVEVDSAEHDTPAVLCPPVPRPRTIPPKSSMVPEEPEGGLVEPAVEPGAEPGVEPGSEPDAEPDSTLRQSRRKLQLTAEEKSQLVNLSFSQDQDLDLNQEAPPPSCIAIGPAKPPRALLAPDGSGAKRPESEGPATNQREQHNRRSFRRKEESLPTHVLGAHNPKYRSKFSPWNLSSPRLGKEHRFGVAGGHAGRPVTPRPDLSQSDEERTGEDDEDDDQEDDVLCLFEDKFQTVPSDSAEAHRLELLKMRTLERKVKLCEMQRFHKAQSIQRRLEEIEMTFKELEEKGVVLERALRGETGSAGPSDMINDWIQLVHQKNALVSEESELMVASRQLELEDQQSMLEKELRHYIEMNDSEKTPQQKVEEERVLQQMLDVVDMRNSLVGFLEEKRLMEMNDQLDGVAILEPKRNATGGAQVHWA